MDSGEPQHTTTMQAQPEIKSVSLLHIPTTIGVETETERTTSLYIHAMFCRQI